MLSCEYCEIFKNSSFNRIPPVPASVCGVFDFQLFNLIWISCGRFSFSRYYPNFETALFMKCFPWLFLVVSATSNNFYSSFCLSELLIWGLFDLKFHVYLSFRVDLAGSERLKKTHAHGERLQEAQNINSSLLELGWESLDKHTSEAALLRCSIG